MTPKIKIMTPKIKAILRIIRPKVFTGEGAFVYTDTLTGKAVYAKTTAPDNIRHLIYDLNGGRWESTGARTYIYDEEMGQRKFNSTVKDWGYVSSNPKDMADYVRAGLDNPETSTW